METLITEKVRQVLRHLGPDDDDRRLAIVLPDVPPDIHYPQKDKALRTLVASRIRAMFEEEEVSLAVRKIFSYAKHPLLAGQTEEKGKLKKYGISEHGPQESAYWKHPHHQARWMFRSVRVISPEELLVHTAHPQEFYDNLLRFLDTFASKILEGKSESVDRRPRRGR